jgi:hypothetical protein
MKVRYLLITDLLCIGIALFGAWCLYAQIAILFRANFITLKTFSIFPVIVVFTYFVFSREQCGLQSTMTSYERKTESYSYLQLPRWFWLLTPFVIVGLFEITGSEWLFWLLSSIYLFVSSRVSFSNSSPIPEPELTITVMEVIGLACICGIVVLLTMGARRPDPDDAFFVSLASAAIDNPGEPLYGFDNLYRSGMPLPVQHLHLLQTYEYFIAVLSDFTRVPIRVLYYIVLPPLFSLVGILANWIVLRRFLHRNSALIGLLMIVILLSVWGDGHRTYGNFAFVRIYQGKAIFLLLALPMIFYVTLEYLNAPKWRNWIFLVLSQGAAVGFTTSGLVVAPLTSSIIILSSIQISRSSYRVAAKGLAASFPLVLLGIGMMYHLRYYHAHEHVDRLLLGYQTVLGEDRTPIVLLVLLLLPALLKSARILGSGWLSSYVSLSSVVLLCPAIPKFLGLNLAKAFSWRILWCLPAPLLLSLTVGAVASKSLARPWLRGCLLSVFLMVFAFAGPFAVSQSNWAWANFGAFKVTSNYKVAQRLMTLEPNNSLALVPEVLAVYLCGFQNAPSLIAVREIYLQKLRGAIPEQDFAERNSLLSYIEGKTDGLTVDWFMSEVAKRGINMVAFRSKHPHADFLEKSLAERGFRLTHYSGNVLAVRSIHQK